MLIGADAVLREARFTGMESRSVETVETISHLTQILVDRSCPWRGIGGPPASSRASVGSYGAVVDSGTTGHSEGLAGRCA